jgi:O-acetyl-ADP-ribose deacetylase (regulator of RNase III)
LRQAVQVEPGHHRVETFTMPLEALRADITTLAVDAIVNAANEGLVQGGGVCGAIFRAAGPAELAEACARVAPCPPGQARITPGFGLPARWVIHSVGPVWRGGAAGEAALLAACYRESLALLRDAGGRSIAFPAISTGIFGYPPGQATRIAVATVREDVARHGDLDITFACFDQAMLDLYWKELAS